MKSPFSYRAGTILEDPVQSTTSVSELNMLIKTKAIDDVDLRILKLLNQYKVLTAALIDQYFSNETFFSNNFSKKRFRKYMRYGLVRRFYTVFDEINDDYKRTVNFYTLSEPVEKYFSNYLNMLFKKDLKMDVGSVFSRLSLNQFAINFNAKNTSVEQLSFDKKEDRVIHFNFNNTHYMVISVRRDQTVSSLLEKIHCALNKNTNILFLVEDELFITELSEKLNGKLDDVYLNFITDQMTLSETMVNSILKISKQEGKFVIREFKLLEVC